MLHRLDNFIIRGSSSGLVRNGEFLGSSDSNCARKTILRHCDVQQTHSPKTLEIFSIGHQFEEYFAKEHPDFQREFEVITDTVKGHVDFISPDGVLYELKSVTSRNTHNSVWKKGEIKIHNALQLLTYLVAMEKQKGILVYGSYTHISTYDKLMKMRVDEIKPLFVGAVPVMKEFVVEIDNQGNALVDGEPFHNIHVSELIEFQDRLHELVKSRTLPPRIESLEPNAWASPCKYCPLQALCDSGIDDLEEFVETATDIFEQENS
jgi:hypothetical protein